MKKLLIPFILIASISSTYAGASCCSASSDAKKPDVVASEKKCDAKAGKKCDSKTAKADCTACPADTKEVVKKKAS